MHCRNASSTRTSALLNHAGRSVHAAAATVVGYAVAMVVRQAFAVAVRHAFGGVVKHAVVVVVVVVMEIGLFAMME